MCVDTETSRLIKDRNIIISLVFSVLSRLVMSCKRICWFWLPNPTLMRDLAQADFNLFFRLCGYVEWLWRVVPVTLAIELTTENICHVAEWNMSAEE